ncbi:hypothetical protein ACQWHJ_24595, partial [Salmonella enterica subsp. enterica serovar Infantis]
VITESENDTNPEQVHESDLVGAIRPRDPQLTPTHNDTHTQSDKKKAKHKQKVKKNAVNDPYKTNLKLNTTKTLK